LYFKIFFASFLIMFMSPEIARSTNDMFLFQIIFKWHIPIVQINLYICGIPSSNNTVNNLQWLLFRPSVQAIIRLF
jgi:hypothetical protein